MVLAPHPAIAILSPATTERDATPHHPATTGPEMLRHALMRGRSLVARPIYTGSRALASRPDPAQADSLMAFGTRDIFGGQGSPVPPRLGRGASLWACVARPPLLSAKNVVLILSSPTHALGFVEEHDMFREMCRKFFDEEVKPHHDRYHHRPMPTVPPTDRGWGRAAFSLRGTLFTKTWVFFLFLSVW